MFRAVPTLRSIAQRAYTTGPARPTVSSTTTAASSPPAGVNANVPGLSNNCVKPSSGPVGPGAAANAAYKVPEYFLFNRFSFAEAEVEMAKFRCPQPSALKK